MPKDTMDRLEGAVAGLKFWLDQESAGVIN
jgi:hypothetical protein